MKREIKCVYVGPQVPQSQHQRRITLFIFFNKCGLNEIKKYVTQWLLLKVVVVFFLSH